MRDSYEEELYEQELEEIEERLDNDEITAVEAGFELGERGYFKRGYFDE